jgi:uncharacterized protein YciI
MHDPRFTRYVIVLHKVAGKELSPDTLRRHIAHLAALDAAGKLVLCGPFADHPSGMVIVQASDKHEATRIAESDPFVREGARTFEVRTWLVACTSTFAASTAATLSPKNRLPSRNARTSASSSQSSSCSNASGWKPTGGAGSACGRAARTGTVWPPMRNSARRAS